MNNSDERKPHVSYRRKFVVRRTVTSMNLVGDEPTVLIFGETPAGITTAVRAARNDPTIVSRRDYFGGMLANSVCVFDTLYSSDSQSRLLSECIVGVHELRVVRRVLVAPLDETTAAI